jgi:glycosyltransferase involved in cell wall biosynthesis
MSDLKFKIVVPTYNAQYWIEDCIYSIESQNYKNFNCVIIDDNSTDETTEIIKNISKQLDDRFKVLYNKENIGVPANLILGYKHLETEKEPESVCIVVDGDDKLFSPVVLDIVKYVYDQTNCLLTYGNHVHYPTGNKSNCERFPQEIINSGNFRKYPKYITSHLRTYKSKIWHQIKDQDLRDPRTGNYFKVGGDVATMYPLIELAGPRHTFIENILYLYNRANPISDDVIRLSEQSWVYNYIISQPKYEPYKG